MRAFSPSGEARRACRARTGGGEHASSMSQVPSGACWHTQRYSPPPIAPGPICPLLACDASRGQKAACRLSPQAKKRVTRMWASCPCPSAARMACCSASGVIGSSAAHTPDRQARRRMQGPRPAIRCTAGMHRIRASRCSSPLTGVPPLTNASYYFERQSAGLVGFHTPRTQSVKGTARGEWGSMCIVCAHIHTSYGGKGAHTATVHTRADQTPPDSMQRNCMKQTNTRPRRTGDW